MTPFIRVPREASIAMIQRASLLARPLDFFKTFFGGHAPTLQEKLIWIEGAIQRMTSLHTYQNNLYVVDIAVDPPFIRLSIRRHDEQPCNQWRHLQQIKNELIGPEYEAVELFPSEGRLVDTNNEYHLWVHSSPSFRFPFGFSTGKERFLTEDPARIPTQPACSASDSGGQTLPISQAA